MVVTWVKGRMEVPFHTFSVPAATINFVKFVAVEKKPKGLSYDLEILCRILNNKHIRIPALEQIFVTCAIFSQKSAKSANFGLIKAFLTKDSPH